MNKLNTFCALIFYCSIVNMVHTYSNTPCSLQEEIPKAVGEPLYMGEDSSPYHIYILNSDGRSVKNFNDQETYTIILNGTTFFRRFLIQSRIATDGGFILTSIRAGEFFNDSEFWAYQGIRFLDCPNVKNDAITQENDRKKYSIEAQWLAKRHDVPIQIFVAVQQDVKSEWLHLAPKSGFIFPDVGDEIKTDVDGERSEEINDQNSTTVKPIYETTKDKKGKSSKIFGPHFYFVVDKNQKMNMNEIDKKKNISKEIDYCSSNPCLNHGICVNIPNDYTFECYCTDEWSGEDCMIRNHCLSHPCMNLGTCINGEYGFTCECLPGWAGQTCERICPPYVCKNDGRCIANGVDGFSCSCHPDWTGKTCETEFDFCSSNPCLHGGSCSEEVDGYECECPKGYMGDRCQRPCQDILLGCEYYDENDFCNSLNKNISAHYQANCASTCGKCATDPSKIKTWSQLPMTLEPLQMLLGSWYIDAQNLSVRYPVDFVEFGKGYSEKIEFLQPFASPFDGSSISFRTTAVNRHDPTDIALNSGFIYINTVQNVNQISVITIGNDGLVLIEEGKMTDKEQLQLNSRYFFVHPSTISKTPMKIKRKFAWNDNKLEINIEKISINGQFSNVTLVFRKEKTNLRSF